MKVTSLLFLKSDKSDRLTQITKDDVGKKQRNYLHSFWGPLQPSKGAASGTQEAGGGRGCAVPGALPGGPRGSPALGLHERPGSGGARGSRFPGAAALLGQPSPRAPARRGSAVPAGTACGDTASWRPGGKAAARARVPGGPGGGRRGRAALGAGAPAERPRPRRGQDGRMPRPGSEQATGLEPPNVRATSLQRGKR